MNHATLQGMRELAERMKSNRTKIVRVLAGGGGVSWGEYEVRQDGKILGRTYTFDGACELAIRAA